MKKIFLFLILFLLPFMVFAKDTCDSSNIEIKSITLNGTKGNIEEVSDASVSHQKINLGLKMNVLGDAAEYKIVLKNNSNEDYYFDEEALNLDLDSVNKIIFAFSNFSSAYSHKKKGFFSNIPLQQITILMFFIVFIFLAISSTISLATEKIQHKKIVVLSSIAFIKFFVINVSLLKLHCIFGCFLFFNT